LHWASPQIVFVQFREINRETASCPVVQY